MVGTFRCDCGYETPPNGSLPVLCPRCGAPAPADSLVGLSARNGEANGGAGDSTAPIVPDVQALLAPPPAGPATPVPGTGSFDVDFAPTAAFGEPTASRPGPVGIPSVPGFDVFGELGRGGMGVVYKARQVSLNRLVALKMILSGSQAGLAERARFRREAEAVAALHHPNIVQIFQVGEHDSQPFLALEFVDGGSLAQYLANGKVWAATDAAWLIAQLARTMQYAHDQGVVHRDLKPGNVLLQKLDPGRAKDTPPSERTRMARLRAQAANRDADAPPTAFEPKVTDFGLAKRLDDSAASAGTKTGAVMGTPSYIAPEQAAGRPDAVGPPADVYALGAILYELLTARPPFKGDTPLDTVLQVLNDEPVPPTRLRPRLAKDLETICLKCLEKEPSRRYATAEDLADDLDRFLVGEPILARPLSAVGRWTKWARRHPAATAIVVMMVASVFTVLTVLSAAYKKVSDANQKIERERDEAKAAKGRAEEEKRKAAEAAEKEKAARELADTQAAILKKQADELLEKDKWNERSLSALQLAQVAALADRSPYRGQDLLRLCPDAYRDVAWRYLFRLCQREVQIVTHTKAVTAVAADPFGVVVASAGDDGPVRVWEPMSGRTVVTLVGHFGRVNGIAFAPDGLTIATGGQDGTVRIWRLPPTMHLLHRDVLRGVDWPQWLNTAIQPVLVLTPPSPNPFVRPPPVRAVAFGDNGGLVAAAGDDGIPRVWDLRPTAAAAVAGWAAPLGHRVQRSSHLLPVVPPPLEFARDPHSRPVLAVAFSPDGKVLATGSDDGFAHIYQLADGKCVPLPRHQSGVPAVAFRPDGRFLATVDNGKDRNDDPGVKLWDLTGRFPKAGRFITGHTLAIQSAAFSPDGTQLVTAGSDQTIRVWDPETGIERVTLERHDKPILAVAFLPGRRMVVSGGADGTARVWRTDVRTADTAETNPLIPYTAAAVAQDGRLVVAGDKNGTVTAWVVDPPALPGRFAPPTGMTLFGGVGIDLTCRKTTDLGPVRELAVSASSRFVVAVGDKGFACWDMTPMYRVVRDSPPMLRPKFVVTDGRYLAAAIAPDGSTAAVVEADGNTRTVRQWNLETGEPNPGGSVYSHPDVRAVAFPLPGPGKANPPYLAIACGTAVRVVNLRNPEWTAVVEDAHPRTVSAVAIAPGGTLLASGDETGGVRLWEIAEQGGFRLKPRFAWCEAEDDDPQRPRAVGHTDGITAVGFTADGKTLLSASRDRTVILWDPVTAQERATLSGHADRVLALAVGRGDKFLMTVGQGGTVKRWRTEESPRPTPTPTPRPFLGGGTVVPLRPAN